MPAQDTETRTRARVNGQWIDPAEYVRINGVWVRRDTDVTPPPPPTVNLIRGTAIAGGSFGDFNALPNVYGPAGHVWDVDNASRTSTAGLQFLRSLGIQYVRLDFRWENLQPTLNAPFDAAELARMTAMFNACKNAGIYFLPDMHNYGHRKTTETGQQAGPSIGDATVPTSAYADFWTRFVQAFGGNDHLLGYEIMNEPVSMTGGYAQSHANDQAAVNAIRALDTQRLIFVDGYAWAHVDNWDFNNGAGTGPWINDAGRTDANGEPLIRYTAHHYFDADSSSTYGSEVPNGPADAGEDTSDRVARHLAEFTDWLDTWNVRGAITEVGWPNTTAWCDVAEGWFDLANAANLDVFTWATGAAWSNTYELRAFAAGIPGDLERGRWDLGDQIDKVMPAGQVLLNNMTAAPPVDPEDPPVSTSLAMPRGPTGSRWGPDATGPDGGRPPTTYLDPASTSFKNFTPFAQAADFYDSIGINHHPYGVYEDANFTAAIIAQIQNIGFRHVRQALFMPNIYHDSVAISRTQRWLADVMNANAARTTTTGGPAGTGKQPIFGCIHTGAERKYWVDNFGTRYSYELVNNDGADPIFRTIEGPVGNIAPQNLGLPTDTWGGTILGRDKTVTGQPMGWGAISSLMSTNEPDNHQGSPVYNTMQVGLDYGIRWIGHEMMRAKNLRTTVTALNGEPWINSTTGRITTSPCKVNQLPVIPFMSLVSSAGWTTVGDYTTRIDADVVAAHEYWLGTQPVWDHKFGTAALQNSRDYNSAYSIGTWGRRNAANGLLNPAANNVRYDRSIPIMCTEMGHIGRFDTPNGTDSFPTPPDVIGEYLIQQLVQQYLQGYKRSYIFAMTDEGAPTSGQQGWGICNNDGTLKASGHAIRNLLALVGFRQGPDQGIQPISIPHTYTGGADTFDDYVGGTPQTTLRVRDLVYKLVLCIGPDEYIIILCRQRPLWGRRTWFNTRDIAASRRTVAEDNGSSRDVVLTLPNPGTGFEWKSEIAEPAKNPVQSPIDGLTYPNPTNGQAYVAAGTAGSRFTQNGNTLTAGMGLITRVIKIKKQQTVVTPPPSTGFRIGMSNEGDNPAAQTELLGASWARNYERDPWYGRDGNWSAMDAVIQDYTSRGIEPIMLVNWSDDLTTLTTADAQNLALWASRYGPGGTFWAGKPSSQTQWAPRLIEFGNEYSFSYRSGDASTQQYADRAKYYAARAKEAGQAIKNTGRPVNLIIIGEDGGSGSANWVNNMYAQVPDLHNYIGGWTIHPYGPTYLAKIQRTVDFLNGKDTLKLPFYLTENGVACDQVGGVGRQLNDNYGWQSNMNYQQCADKHQEIVDGLRSSANISRILGYFIYQPHDQIAPGGTYPGPIPNNKEGWFGVLTNTGGTKGAITPKIQSLMALYGGSTSVTPPATTVAPYVSPSVGATPAQLKIGDQNGSRLQLKGVNLWGVLSPDTNNAFAMAQYNARTTIANSIQIYGANCVRLRINASEYNTAPNAATGNLTKAQILGRIADWVTEFTNRQIYVCICTWDALDGTGSDAAWPNNGTIYHQMWSDLHFTLNSTGPKPYVFYEVTNEPNLVGYNGSDGHDTTAWNAWENNMEASITHFRQNMQYRGPLVIDPIWWANSGTGGQGYDDARYTNLENVDAIQPGMDGIHQIIFAKHDYSNGAAWSDAGWVAGAGAGQIKHLIFENEFGHYNGSPASVNNSWSAAATTYFKNRFTGMTNYVGGCAFLWGPWYDANAITVNTSAPNGDNTTPSSPWGGYVDTNFLS